MESSQTQTGAGPEQTPRSILDRVGELAHLNRAGAAKALNVVLCVLEQRLSGGEAQKVEAELAPILELARIECPREDEEQAELFDRSEFFQRAGERLPGRGLATGRIVAATLAAIRERTSPRLAADVGNQLPADLRTLWEAPLPQELPLPPLPALQHNRSRTVPLSELAAAKPNRCKVGLTDFLGRMAQRASVSEPEAESIVVTVLWFLLRRIPAPVGEKLSREVPREIQIQLQDALLHGGKVPDWDLYDYYAKIAEQLKLHHVDVVPLVHSAFDLVRETVAPKTVEKVGSELPASIRDVWLATPFAPADPSC